MYSSTIAQLGLVCAVFLSTASGSDTRREDKQWPQASVGASHGDFFDDAKIPNAGDHKRIGYVNMFGCGKGEHLNAIEIGWRDNHAPGWAASTTTIHGSKIGQPISYILAKDEWINEVWAYTYMARVGFLKSNYKTRIGNLQLTTNKGHKLSRGAYDDDDPAYQFLQTDSALLFFSGRSGDAVDEIKVHWIPKEHF